MQAEGRLSSGRAPSRARRQEDRSFSPPGLVLVEGGKQEGNVQLPGTVGAAVAAARTGHRIEAVEHVADLPHQGDLLLGQRLAV